MEVIVHRNLSAIRFVRCATRIPGSNLFAGGAGFTLSEALAKCDSEVVERHFQLHELRPAGIRPVGIAAHRNFELASARAMDEAMETLCVKQVHGEGVMRCLWVMRFLSFTLGLSRTERGYFCMIRGRLSGRRVAAHSAARTLFGVLLKTWEEYQSFHFFKPVEAALANYTKANILFSQPEFDTLEFRLEPKFTYRPQLSALVAARAERSGRKIVYVYNPKGV